MTRGETFVEKHSHLQEIPFPRQANSICLRAMFNERDNAYNFRRVLNWMKNRKTGPALMPAKTP